MSVMIQVRKVPDPIHRLLKARAAMAGSSLSNLILEHSLRLAALPSESELPAHLVREERDAA